jgi:ankyrin repeat protein
MTASTPPAPAFPPLALSVLLVVGGCHGQSSPNAAPRAQELPSAVTQTLDIERHFHGDALALANAAARGDAVEVARLVRERHADPDAISSGGLPLIAWPILQGNAAGVRALLDNGADANLAVPGAGTVMVWAASAKDPAILAAFLDHRGDADARNRDGEPLLKLAALANAWDNVRLLVERGADVDAHSPGQPGDTVLGYYSAGQFDKAQWLLEHDADPGYRIATARSPERVGAQPIVENIYWWPVNAGRFPQLAHAQQRCQALIAERGFTMPKEPAHLQRLRASQSGAAGDGAAAAEPFDARPREAALKDRLDSR